MDYKIIFIGVGVLLIGLIVMITLNKKARGASGVAQDVMKQYVLKEVPSLQSTSFKVINILEDAINANHIWVTAYNNDGMFLIPSLPNPISRTISRYEDLTPAFDIKKQIASTVLVGDKSEEIDYVPFSAVSDVVIDRDKKKIEIHIGDAKKKFKYQNKDCFGADQEEVVYSFISKLSSISNR